MRLRILGLIAGIALLSVYAGMYRDANPTFAQTGPPTLSGRGELIALTAKIGENQQQITLIDPQRGVMGVYHIDGMTGEISLRSVRNTHWDLMMDEFNGSRPSPREIRSLLER